MGVSPRITQLGFARGRCPACREEVDLHLIREAQTISLFFVPLIPLHSRWLATCPHCASISAVHADAAKAIRSGRRHSLDPEDLELVQNNRGLFCQSCHARVEAGQNFCPGCGQKL